MSNIHKVCIIGGGCAGLSAGIYCSRANLNPIIFTGDYDEKGGLLMKTSIVENYPGYLEINGYELIENMENQAIKHGAKVINRLIKNININKNPFELIDSENDIYYSETIIIATGSKPNKLNLPLEDKFWANGISSCAVCDGALFRNKKIVVIGGGDSAMEEALFLTKFSEVKLIHRRDKFRASKIMQERVLSNPKIKIIYNSIITELHGNNSLESITIKNLLTNEITNLEVDGLFYGLGLTPNTELFQRRRQNLVDMDQNGYIVCNHPYYSTMTSIPGIFVAGDAHDKIYKQAIVAAGEGCKAALDVDRYLNEK